MPTGASTPAPSASTRLFLRSAPRYGNVQGRVIRSCLSFVSVLLACSVMPCNPQSPERVPASGFEQAEGPRQHHRRKRLAQQTRAPGQAGGSQHGACAVARTCSAAASLFFFTIRKPLPRVLPLLALSTLDHEACQQYLQQLRQGYERASGRARRRLYVIRRKCLSPPAVRLHCRQSAWAHLTLPGMALDRRLWIGRSGSRWSSASGLQNCKCRRWVKCHGTVTECLVCWQAVVGPSSRCSWH